MKIINILTLNKNIKKGSEKQIPRADGVYKDIINSFENDRNYSSEMIQDIKEKNTENELLQEALENGPSNFSIFEQYSDDMSDSLLIISDALYYKKDLQIGYFTYDYNIYIERDIRPEYIYSAKTTGNNVLVSWCYNWNDYRAFILDNIVFAKELNKNPIQE